MVPSSEWDEDGGEEVENDGAENKVTKICIEGEAGLSNYSWSKLPILDGAICERSPRKQL